MCRVARLGNRLVTTRCLAADKLCGSAQTARHRRSMRGLLRMPACAMPANPRRRCSKPQRLSCEWATNQPKLQQACQAGTGSEGQCGLKFTHWARLRSRCCPCSGSRRQLAFVPAQQDHRWEGNIDGVKLPQNRHMVPHIRLLGPDDLTSIPHPRAGATVFAYRCAGGYMSQLQHKQHSASPQHQVFTIRGEQPAIMVHTSKV